MGKEHRGPERIVTCCYCSARSVVPRDPRALARLVCAGCGAPIKIVATHLPADSARKKSKGRKPAIPHPAERPGQHAETDRPVRRKKGKRRKGIYARFREALDDLDDVDDLFDFFD